MYIDKILTADRTCYGAAGASKKRVLQNVADFISTQVPGFDGATLFRALIERERLGSTGLGEGIAIPHCRMENCLATTGALFKLEEPIDFDAPDDQPVDILFVLIAPAEASSEHLSILAELAGLFNTAEYRASLRAASSDEELFRCAIETAHKAA